ncbi:RRQRL motif-containing zinc-binding protein [Kitasatospora sp. NPDC092039]|uniref:RRQRL motif-containing zinc-binding protein n=1 Tax=Kitasatospora sp. NPDC092039 TaxID=3364086 RepID=UPI00381A1E1A
MRASDLDPSGEDHGGLPTWPWRYADPGLHTRRIAYLYRIEGARPVRPMTPGRAAALDRAMAARQTCPLCRVRYDACLPLKTLGSCLPCAELSDDEREQLAALTNAA